MPLPVPVVLMIGQSNMRLPAVATSAASNIAENGGIAVFHAIGGTPLAPELDKGQGDWSASPGSDNGEHLDELRFRIDAILDTGSPAHIPGAYIAGTIWVQGEADSSTEASSQDYEDNLLELRDTLVEEYGAHDWAIASLSGKVWELRPDNATWEPRWNDVRSAQIELDSDAAIQTVDPDALADKLGYASRDMFTDDNVHYGSEFGAELGDALADKLNIEGNASMQAGTIGNDYFVSHTEGPGQLFGSRGLDTADFSELEHGIKVTAYARELTSVEGKNGPEDYKMNMIEIERVVGTDFDDVYHLGTSTYDIRAGDGNDKIFGTDRNDSVRGDDGDDVAHGRGGNDNLRGKNGDDRLFGHEGNDRLIGGKGDDVLHSGHGDDYVYAGAGDDDLRLSKGMDTIVYGRGNNGTDEIRGFTTRDDVLDMQKTGATLDDLFLSVEDSNLRIELEMESSKASILIVNGARYMPGEDEEEPPDWILL